MGPQNAVDGAEVAEGLDERGAADDEITGGAGCGERAQEIDRSVFEGDNVHGGRVGEFCWPGPAEFAAVNDPFAASLAIASSGA